MKERNFEIRMKDLQAPAPDPAARLRAKRAALAEFARVQTADKVVDIAPQESDEVTRLSREPSSRRSKSMKFFANRHWYAAAAGIGVLAIGLTWVLPNLSRYSEELAAPEQVGPVSSNAEPADLPAASATSPADPEPMANAAAAPAEVAPEPIAPPGTIAPVGPVSPRVDAGTGATAQRQERDDVREALAAAQARQETSARQDDEARVAAVVELQKREQQSAAPEEPEEVVVTGSRFRAQPSLEAKRNAPVSVADQITAEDVASMPAKSVAGALQRVPAPPPPPGISGFTSPVYQESGRDRFATFEANPVRRVTPEDYMSTFSADVDTASYSFARGQLHRGVLPQKDAVRSEEMVNYFDYAWPAARDRSAPFKPTVVVGDSPWNKGKKLVHIGIKGYELDRGEAPDANLVLLLDVSGSMNAPNKLPLAVRSMELLLESLKPSDTVGIVVYAGAAGTVLEPTPVREKQKILEALRSLRPGGSTAGAEGIERAYALAEQHFRKGGVNRILLATDGDFNVGISNTDELKGYVERKREKGVYLSVLGFGQGNYRDELAQALAQNGNGVAAYIDSEGEAQKVLVREASSSLFTIAKDVKLQVEFNSATVSEYRLVGYETRALKREDFNNDAVDAGDVGAGHTVTAIYELTPVGVPGAVDEPYFEANRRTDDVKRPAGDKDQDLYGFLKIRYKLPDENRSRLITEPIPMRSREVPAAVARDVAFSTAVAGFAQLLRGGTYTGSLSYEDVIEQAQRARGEDPHGDRAEFLELVRRAQKAGGK
jgi:Ca-activated chloride channel family protein